MEQNRIYRFALLALPDIHTFYMGLIIITIFVPINKTHILIRIR